MNPIDSEWELENLLHNVKWLREKHGLSKWKMCAIMGISIKTLNKMEQGVFLPRMGMDAIWRTVKHFDVPVKELMQKKFQG